MATVTQAVTNSWAVVSEAGSDATDDFQMQNCNCGNRILFRFETSAPDDSSDIGFILEDGEMAIRAGVPGNLYVKNYPSGVVASGFITIAGQA